MRESQESTKEWRVVPRIAAPSAIDFKQRHLDAGAPAIFTGMVDHWAAFHQWTPEYLEKQFGSSILSAYEAQQRRMVSSTELGLPVHSLSISEALQRLDTVDGIHLSAWVEDIPELLQRQIENPAYCETVSWLRRRFWITSSEMVTPTHQDPYDNLYAVLRGRKRFLLLPPRPRGPLYPYPMFSRIPNFSRVDLESPDLESFPLFGDVQPLVAEVKAGELLYIPNLWWHHTRTLEPTIAVNFFWSSGWMVALTKLASIYRRIRKI